MKDSPAVNTVHPRVGVSVLDALSHPVRLHVVRTVGGVGRPYDIETVVESLVESEVETADRESVEIQLYHSHLPKLAAAGLIEYDWRSGTIVPSPDIPHLLLR